MNILIVMLTRKAEVVEPRRGQRRRVHVREHSGGEHLSTAAGSEGRPEHEMGDLKLNIGGER